MLEQNHLTRPDGPAANRSAPVVVSLKFDLISISEVDPPSGVVRMVAYLMLQWKDERLAAAFDPTCDASIQNVIVPIDNQQGIWIPDVELYRMSPPGLQVLNQKNNAVVYRSGDAMWVPHVALSVPCVIDRFAPFNCTLKFGSWVHNGNDLDMAASGPVDMSSFIPSNPRWLVHGTPTIERKENHYPCCPDPYPVIEINIPLRRRQSE